MAFVTYPPVNISQAIEVLKQDVELTHGIVHGDENTEVLTENGAVPSFKNVIEYLKDEVAAATGVDVSLRSDLAAINSSVLIGGVTADNVGKLFRNVMYVEAPAGDAGVFLNTLVSLGVEYIVCSGGNFVFETSLVVTSTKLKIHGAGSTKTLFKRGSSLGTANIITGSLHDLEVHHIGFDTGKGTYTPTLASPILENAINSVSPTRLSIKHCAFNNLVNMGVIVNGTVGNEAYDVDISNNNSANGTRGFVAVRRYGNRVRVDNNVLYNTVDVPNTLFKPMEVSGSLDVFICDNKVTQDNGAGGPIIVEFIDRQSTNVHIERNSYYGPTGESQYKVGAAGNVWFRDNHASGLADINAYFEGCENLWIEGNRLVGARRNNLVLAQDFDTSKFNKKVKIYNNHFVDANVANATVGIPYISIGSNDSYHLWIQDDTEDVEVVGNYFVKGTHIAGGMLLSSPSYIVEGNNFAGLDNLAITLNNSFSPIGAKFRIANNIACQTIDKGTVVVGAGSASATFSPKIHKVFGNTQLTLKSALSGTVTYIFADNDIPPDVAVACRDSSHNPATPTNPVTVDWSVDCSKTAKGVLGKTD